MKYLKFIVIVLLFNINPVVSASATAQDAQLTPAEAQEAQKISESFTDRFLETGDLTPIVNDLYVNDFIERYKIQIRNALADEGGSQSSINFVPGLDYDPRLLAQASSEEWRRFYIASHNFLLFGLFSSLNKLSLEKLSHNSENTGDIKSTDLYPPSVIELLDQNPNLANMIKKKGPSKAISTPEEMRNATATLEQAVAVMREQQAGKSLRTEKYQQWARLVKMTDVVKPHLEITDGDFNFPKGTRVITIDTPFLVQLLLVKGDNGLRILWARPDPGD